MNRSKIGPIVTAVILSIAAVFLYLNRETGTSSKGLEGIPKTAPKGAGGGGETPIGDEVIKNHIEIAAVWLPSVGMAGMPDPSGDVIHVEADVRATANNPNGFAKDEFVPYLKIKYEVVDPKSGKSLQSGDLMPMVANDGLHYGANIARPAPGTYRLVYKIAPPSAGGLGRHSDKATGVASWWEPFEVSIELVMDRAGK